MTTINDLLQMAMAQNNMANAQNQGPMSMYQQYDARGAIEMQRQQEHLAKKHQEEMEQVAADDARRQRGRKLLLTHKGNT